MAVKAAGIILYRTQRGLLEVLLVHPGGPFWKNKDGGCWSIPKGRADNGEDGEALFEVAKREFKEETGFSAPHGPYSYVGEVVRASDRKVVKAWACEGEINTEAIHSNLIEIEWPPKSGRKVRIPEVDRGEFVSIAEAKKKIFSYLVPLLVQFERQMLR